MNKSSSDEDESNYDEAIMKLSINRKVFISTYLRWSTITYWEYNKPYDEQFNLYEKSCHIYDDKRLIKSPIKQQLFRLKNIQQNLTSQRIEITKARQLISNGIVVALDDKSKMIRLDNHCECSVYWICPGLYDAKFIKNNYKSKQIKPGESALIYNYDLVKSNESKSSDNQPLDWHIINVSFGKCWGFDSKRKSIEYCPCWINISINIGYFS